MQAIIAKLQELAGEMKEKNASLSVELGEARKKNTKLEEMLADAKEQKADLDKRESEVSFVESGIALKKEAEELMSQAGAKAQAVEDEKNKMLAVISDRQKVLDEGLKAVEAAKEGIERQKERLADEEKNYKAKVLQSVQRDLDAAKKV